MKLKKHQKIAIVMGSQSDFSTMKDCVKILKNLKISFDLKIVSAHRTPKRLYEFAKRSEKSYSVIIAGAGGICPFTWNDCLFNICPSHW